MAPVLMLLWTFLQLPAGKPDPQLEITEKRVECFKESMQELQQVSKWLESLGDPRKKEDGESTDAYYQRVHKIFRHRAQLLVLFQRQYEEALEIRYELEADLKEYTGRILDQEAKAGSRRQDIERRKAALKQERDVVRSEGIVAMATLHDAAVQER